MLQLEGPHEAKDIQGHPGNVYSMPIAISLRQTTSYHVSITNGFHLWRQFLISEFAPSKGSRNQSEAINHITNTKVFENSV